MNDRAYAKTLNGADFLINVFSPRGHFVGGGFTLGFKSHYGTYTSPSSLHSNADTALVEINCDGPVFQKTIVSMCSGIFGMNERNGPTGSPDDFSTYVKTVDEDASSATPSTIIMSTDPISCEMQAIKLMRLNKSGGKYGIDDMPTYLKSAAGVSGASYNIGVIDESAMDIREIINGEGGPSGNMKASQPHLSRNGTALQVSHLPNQGLITVRYTVPQIRIGQQAAIEIVNMKGNRVFSTKRTIGGAVNRESWNGKSVSGNRAPAGTYIVRVSTGNIRMTEHIILTR
jgi:hypothetical protein